MSFARSMTVVAVLFGGVAMLSAVSCSRHITDSKDASEPVIHELWPDEEAELMALLISAKPSAPRKLYDQVQSELAFIRKNWGDSIPFVRKMIFYPPFSPGLIEMSVDTDVYSQMQEGKYTAWDSQNQRYGLASLRFGEWSNVVFLQMGTRVNPRILVSAYQGLPGVRWIESAVGGGDGPRLFGFLDGTDISYLFEDAWGDCYAGCIYGHYWYFRSVKGEVSYVGEYVPNWDNPGATPAWWPEANRCIDLYYWTPLWERSDTIAPTRIADLLAGNPTGNSITLSWTAPYDGGSSGLALRYELRYSKSAIDDSTWSGASVAYGLPSPGAPGSTEHFVLQGLASNTTYHFAIKSVDYASNRSAISNSCSAATEPIPGWTTYTYGNSGLTSHAFTAIGVEPSGTLWCGAESGLSRFDGTVWTTFTSSNSGMPYEYITAIACEPTGVSWFSCSQGVARYDGHEWATFRADSNGLANSNVQSMTLDSAGGVWFGHVNGKVSRFVGGMWTRFSVVDAPGGLNPIWSMSCDKDGNIWLGTDVGAYKYDGVSWTSITKANSGITANNVRIVSADRYGIWFAHSSEWHGISRYSGGIWTRYTNENSGFPYARVRSATLDPRGVAWFATPAGAVYYNGTGWNSVTTGNSGLVSDDVRAIGIDHKGDTWFGTSAGLCRFSGPQLSSASPPGEVVKW